MKRWVFNLAAGVSLLLCIVTLATWMRSYSTSAVPSAMADGTWRLVAWRGRFILCYSRFVPADPAARITCDLKASADNQNLVLLGKEVVFSADQVTVISRPFQMLNIASAPRAFNLFGFHAGSTPPPDPRKQQFLSAWSIAIPSWFVVMVGSILPVWWAWTWKKARRYPIGHCSICGYDLCATPEQCPECGAVAKETEPKLV